jgi:endophilin-B
MEALIKRSDSTKNLTEKMIYSTEAVLQPNPQERLEDFVLSKLDRRVTKPNNLELLGLLINYTYKKKNAY